MAASSPSVPAQKPVSRAKLLQRFICILPICKASTSSACTLRADKNDRKIITSCCSYLDNTCLLLHGQCMILHGSSKVGKSSSLPANRERHILDRLRRYGQVNASALAEEFSTSEDTIRRDLRELAARGLCQRVYGGAVVTSPAWTPIAVRLGESHDRKEALGRSLETLLRPKQFVYID